MYDFVIIAGVLTGAPVPEPAKIEFAVRHELMDPADSALPADLRARVLQSYKFPRIWEAELLPPQWVCREHLKFNRAHDRWLSNAVLMDERYGPQARENNAIWEFWNNADDATNLERSVWMRRRSLAECRRFIDAESWYARDFPPAVPIWRFWNE